MSEGLRKALESGELTPRQLRELVEIEAAELGLTLDEAVESAEKRSLPKTPLGTDVEFLIALMQEERSAA